MAVGTSGAGIMPKKIFICSNKNARAGASRKLSRYSLMILIYWSYQATQQSLQTVAFRWAPIVPP